MRSIIVLLLIIGIVTAKTQFGMFDTYGQYCGFGYGSSNGTRPIDDVDRICQIHDICITATSYVNCHCAAQLYYSVYHPNNTLRLNVTAFQQKEAEDMAWWIYLTSPICIGWERYNIAEKFYVAGTRHIGYNYLPLYDVRGSQYIMASNNVSIVAVTDQEYIETDWNNMCADYGDMLRRVRGGPWRVTSNSTNIVIINCNPDNVVIYHSSRSSSESWTDDGK